MWISNTVRAVVAIVFSAVMFSGCYTMVYHGELYEDEKIADIVYVPYPVPEPEPSPRPIIVIIPPAVNPPYIPEPSQPVYTPPQTIYRTPENNEFDRNRNGNSTQLRDNDGGRSGNNNRSDNNRSETRRR